MKFRFEEPDFGGCDVSTVSITAAVLGVEYEGRFYPFEQRDSHGNQLLFVHNDGFLEVICDGEESIAAAAITACEAVGDDDQNLLFEFEKAFKRDAVIHMSEDHWTPEFRELFSFERS